MYSGLRAQPYQFERLSNGARFRSPTCRKRFTGSNRHGVQCRAFPIRKRNIRPDNSPCPVAAASNYTAVHLPEFGCSIDAFTASDPGRRPYHQITFWDSGSSGHWVNGLRRTNVEIDVTAAQLTQTSYRFGQPPSSCMCVSLTGWHGAHGNPSQPVHFPNHAPVVNAPSFPATHNQTLRRHRCSRSRTRIATPSATSSPDFRRQIRQVATWSSMDWVQLGAHQRYAVDVTAAQLAGTTFRAARDRMTCGCGPMTGWSGRLEEFHVNAPVDAKPVVTADAIATHNQASRHHRCSFGDRCRERQHHQIPILRIRRQMKRAATGWLAEMRREPMRPSTSVTAAQLGVPGSRIGLVPMICGSAPVMGCFGAIGRIACQRAGRSCARCHGRQH